MKLTSQHCQQMLKGKCPLVAASTKVYSYSSSFCPVILKNTFAPFQVGECHVLLRCYCLQTGEKATGKYHPVHKTFLCNNVRHH